MKILIIAHRLPYPLDRGDRVRLYNIARVLSEKHELTLLSFYENDLEKQHISILGEIFKDIHLVRRSRMKSWMRTAFGIFRRVPLQVSHFRERSMRSKAWNLLDSRHFDAVYAYHLRMAQYVQHRTDVYKILDLVDSISLFMQRMYTKRSFLLRPLLWLEWRRVCRYEEHITGFFEECWIVSEADRREVRGHEKAKIQVVPQAIDFKKFVPGREPEDGPPTLLFVGYMGTESVSAIQYFMQDIFPTIRVKIPETTLEIVGANPPESIKRFGRDPNVNVRGFVKSLPDFYRKATVVIAPMRFVAGMQTKLLEAMAMRKAIVATTWSNEGIDAEDGKQLLIADTPEHFAECVIRLLNDHEKRAQMGTSAADYVKRFSWYRAAERLESIRKQLEPDVMKTRTPIY